MWCTTGFDDPCPIKLTEKKSQGVTMFLVEYCSLFDNHSLWIFQGIQCLNYNNKVTFKGGVQQHLFLEKLVTPSFSFEKGAFC